MSDNGLRSACSPAALERALDVLEGRWKILIIYHLFGTGVLRFSELQRLIPGISQKMLSHQLRDLEKGGIVDREVFPEVPPRVEYALTRDGRALQPALAALQDWAILRDSAETAPVKVPATL